MLSTDQRIALSRIRNEIMLHEYFAVDSEFLYLVNKIGAVLDVLAKGHDAIQTPRRQTKTR